MIEYRKKREEIEHFQRDRWLISYADLVTLLLALFIVLFAASNQERAKQIAESFSAQNLGGDGILPENNSVKKSETVKVITENPILMQKVKMQQTEKGLVVSLSEAGFFAPGEATMNNESDEVIDSLANSLNKTQFQVRIEGHTDSIPISNSQYASNWELSTARAVSVLQKLTERGINSERLSVSGYGGFRPIADNSTAEGRAQNRRVDVVVLNR